MIDDWSHLVYHQERADELCAEAAVYREINRARRRKQALRRERQRELFHALLVGMVSAHRAAKAARHDAWLDATAGLRSERVVRTA